MADNALAAMVVAVGSFAVCAAIYMVERRLKGMESTLMTLQEAVASVETAVVGVADGVAKVQQAVSEVIDDLRNSGASQETIDKLTNAADTLGSIAANASTAAQSLKDADPTPPEG